MKITKKLTAAILAVIMLVAVITPLEISAASSTQIYYKIDMSAAVLKSRIQQQVSSDCAVVSMATIEAYLYGATSSADKTKVYNALVSKNKDDNYAYWGNCGYVTATIDWTAVYNQLAKGYPCIIHRPATSNKSEHWAVVAGYNGSSTTLQKDKFIVVDVYHGTGGTDIYTSSAWANGTTINRMAYRKNGISITSLSGIKFAIDHPSLVHKYGTGHGVYGYVTSNVNLTEIKFTVTNAVSGATVYTKTVIPNSKSYLVYNLDSEFTFAKWPVGEYFFTVNAKTATQTNNYQKYFQIASGWPTSAPSISYSFAFNSNGGNGSLSAQTVNHGGVLSIPTATPTRSGYTFEGWNVKRTTDGKWYCSSNGWRTDADITAHGYTPKLYLPGETYGISYEWIRECMNNRGYTFYAVWKSNSVTTYTVTLTDNGNGTANIAATVPAGIASGKLVIDVSDRLSYISGSLNSVNGAVINESYSGGMLCISFSDVNAFAEGTVVFTADFRINGNSALSVNDFTAPEWNVTDGNERLSSEADGDVIKLYEKKNYKLGDANGDGYVDNIDSAMILKYDAGIIGSDSINLAAADVNGDGGVDNLDSAFVLKYDAGIISGFGR